MTNYAVIDTNVLVSALLSRHADASTVQVLDAFFSELFIPVLNEKIFMEYQNVLYRPKFSFPENDIQKLLNAIRTYGIYTQQLITGIELPDPKDLVFYEVVMAKRDCNAHLITGNIKHFPNEPFIVTPNEFLQILHSTL